jgi:hypothetical protein
MLIIQTQDGLAREKKSAKIGQWMKNLKMVILQLSRCRISVKVTKKFKFSHKLNF